MIHRFLLYDRSFNCRLDRAYPVLPASPPPPVPPVTAPPVPHDAEDRAPSSPDGAAWHRVLVHRPRFRAVASVDEFDGLAAALDQQLQLRLSPPPPAPVPEHSQQLLLGMTFSLRNMLVKLGTTATTSTPTTTTTTTSGYSFNFKTSRYRLVFFEAFTGWRFILLTDTIHSLPALEAALPRFYEGLFCDFVVRYPLGSVLALRHGAIPDDCIFQRPGFINRLDDFLLTVK